MPLRLVTAMTHVDVHYDSDWHEYRVGYRALCHKSSREKFEATCYRTDDRKDAEDTADLMDQTHPHELN